MDEIPGLIEATKNRIYALRERLQSTLRQDYPSDTPQLLGGLLIQLVDKVDDALNNLCPQVENASSSRRRTLSRHVRLHAQSVRKLAPYLRYVEGARLEHNPWHIVGQFERLCRHIVPHARIIIRPKWKYNYEASLLNRELENCVLLPRHEVRPIFDRAPSFFALSYTSAESDDLLQYANWGHEIGHVYSLYAQRSDSESDDKFLQVGTDAVTPFEPADIDRLLDARLRSVLGIQPEELSPGDLEEERNLLVTQLTRIRVQWLREMYADLFAIRLFGPAALFAFAAMPLTEDELDRFAPTHPMPRLRLRYMLEQVERLGYQDFFEDPHMVSERDSTKQTERAVKDAWRSWHGMLQGVTAVQPVLRDQEAVLDDPALENEFYELRRALLVKDLTAAMPAIVREVNEKIQGDFFCSASDEGMQRVFALVESLSHDLPPEVSGRDPRCLGLILTAGWLYWTTYCHTGAEPGSSHRAVFERRKTANRLLSKGIEAATIQAEFEERKRYAPRKKQTQSPAQELKEATDGGGSGILVAPDLLRRLNETDLNRRLGFFPLLEQDQIEADSIDIRLGNTFLVTRRTSFPAIDVTAGEEEFKEHLEQYQQRIYVPMGRPFYIHPGQFVLASSLEFLSMPRDLGGMLVAKASWGRLGISGPTTTKVAPGFKGCLTIELGNLGESPVPLYPGVRIAQLQVQTLTRMAAYHGRYEVPTSTQFSRVYEDCEMAFLGELRTPLVIGVTGLSKSGRSRVVNYLREEGFHDQSLIARRRDLLHRTETRHGKSPDQGDQGLVHEIKFVMELRRSRGEGILVELLLQELAKTPLDRVVVEGIERLEEIELLASQSHFFLIGIKAPFARRLVWWNQDYADSTMTEEQLRKRDIWELYGVSEEGIPPANGAPRVQACIERARYHISNDGDKDHLHKQLEEILKSIILEQISHWPHPQ